MNPLSRMPIPIFVDEVLGRLLPKSAEPLGTVRRHPDEVTRHHVVPAIAQPINAFAFEHEQPMLHDVHFDHGQLRAWCEGHGVHGEIEVEAIRNKFADPDCFVIEQREGGDLVLGAKNAAGS